MEREGGIDCVKKTDGKRWKKRVRDREKFDKIPFKYPDL